MGFIGAAYALVMVAAFPNVVQLKWTNPPDLDIKSIRFQCWQVGSGDTLEGTRYYGLGYETVPPILYGSSPDSVWFVVPCRGSVSQWGFRCYVVDTAGNVSGPSNYAYKTIYPQSE